MLFLTIQEREVSALSSSFSLFCAMQQPPNVHILNCQS